MFCCLAIIVLFYLTPQTELLIFHQCPRPEDCKYVWIVCAFPPTALFGRTCVNRAGCHFGPWRWRVSRPVLLCTVSVWFWTAEQEVSHLTFWDSKGLFFFFFLKDILYHSSFTSLFTKFHTHVFLYFTAFEKDVFVISEFDVCLEVMLYHRMWILVCVFFLRKIEIFIKIDVIFLDLLVCNKHNSVKENRLICLILWE